MAGEGQDEEMGDGRGAVVGGGERKKINGK